MSKKSVIETKPSKFKKGGPEPHKRFQRDGEAADDEGTVEGALRAFKIIVKAMPADTLQKVSRR